MSQLPERATRHPCEDCGAVVVVGPEPVDRAMEGSDEMAPGTSTVASEWCTNLDCSSNRRPRGFHRVGVNRYVCESCGAVLTGAMSAILEHRRVH